MLYRDGKVTLRKAAKIADVSLWEMMEIVKERKVPIQYDYEDFRADFEAALKEK
jgi:predicted HTH domain antitoxin